MICMLKRLGFAALAAGIAGGVQAADIALSDGQGMGCQIRIDGPIVPGDVARLDRVLQETPEVFDTATPIGQRVCLDSAGGSLIEAVRMVSLIAERDMGTAVPAGATCESACAVLFLAGRFSHPEGEGFIPDRILHPRGTLGFHAPALVVEDRTYAKGEINQAYSVALSTMGEILRLRSEWGVRVADSLFLTILNTPADDMTYVETVEQAARWQIEVAPVALTAMDVESALRHACLNADGGLMDARPSDSYLYGSANLPFSYGDLGEASARVTSQPAFRSEAAAECRLVLFGSDEPLQRLGYLTMEGGASNEMTRHEVYSYLFHDPRLALSDLPVARNEAETGEEAFFTALRRAARKELTSVEVTSCWLLDPEARVVNVSEFVNLREGPGFDGAVLRQVPLGERVRVIGTQDLRTIGAAGRAQQCLRACNALPLDPGNTALRSQVEACIDANVFWYEIRDAANTPGFVSRKFLGD
jgi:hypothetical protein